jgi:hypothetical protein
METLSFDFNALIIHLLRVEYARILFFPLWKLGGGFKPAAVTTTYVDNISGKAGAIVAAQQGPAVATISKKRDYVNLYNGIASPVAPHILI